jgi:hypothetical protein
MQAVYDSSRLTFVVATVPGVPLGLDRLPGSPLRFRLLDAAFGAGPVALAAGTWLAATRTASGAYVGYGEFEGPDGVRRRLTGAPVTFRLWGAEAETRTKAPEPFGELRQRDRGAGGSRWRDTDLRRPLRSLPAGGQAMLMLCTSRTGRRGLVWALPMIGT